MTINKTSDLDNNTDTLKKLTGADKPNNQTKLASVGAIGIPLPPSQMKCNILKGDIYKQEKKFIKPKIFEEKIQIKPLKSNKLHIYSTCRRRSESDTDKIDESIICKIGK